MNESSTPATPAPDVREGFLGVIDNAAVPLLLGRLAVGATYVYLGLQKTGYPLESVHHIELYEIVPLSPPIIINVLAVVLPWLEVLIGLALILGSFLRGAALLGGSLLFVFTVAIFVRALNYEPYVLGQMGFTEIEFECGCGSGVVNVAEKLILNSVLVLISVPVLLTRCRRFCIFRG